MSPVRQQSANCGAATTYPIKYARGYARAALRSEAAASPALDSTAA